MSSIHTFKDQLGKYLSKTENPFENLIKFESSNGPDFSFVVNLKLWSNYTKIDDIDKYKDNIIIYAAADDTTDECQGLERLKNASEKFIFKINHLDVKNMKCYVQIHRTGCIKDILNLVVSNDYGKVPKQGQTIAINHLESESSITNFRLQTIALVLRNLTKYSQYDLVHDSSSADYKLLLTTRSNIKQNETLNENIKVLCSVVHDSTKKISQESVDDYLTRKMDELHLIAIHKYGIRAESNEKFLKMREKFGLAACKLDMMENKHSNALILKQDTKQAFILYNSARIETLLKSFEDKVEAGYYPKLPEFDDIEFGLLAGDGEWVLIKQLLLFPETVLNAIGDLKNGKINVHLIYKYLQGFTTAFSNYYSRKRILTENRQQLMPALQAKIYLLKAIRNVLNKTLEIFEIEPVSFM